MRTLSRLAMLPFLMVGGCQSADGPARSPRSAETPRAASRTDQGTPDPAVRADRPVEPPVLVNPKVRFRTTEGEFIVELDASATPLTTLNFMDYVEAGFYDGLIFHRIPDRHLIQGGRFTPEMRIRDDGLRPPIDAERDNSLANVRGAVAMVSNPAMLKSTQAEFLINVTDNPHLDETQGGDYVAFGRVIEGMEAVDKIAYREVAAHPDYAAGLLAQVPVDPVIIKDASLVSDYSRPAVVALLDERRRAEQERMEALALQKAAEFDTAVDQLFAECQSPPQELGTGVRYCDVRVGEGATPVPTDRVLINFSGRLIDGTVLNDTFQEGGGSEKSIGSLIPGMRAAMMTMQEGGRRHVLVPPDHAFGSEGIPGRIPANAYILFEVELLEILSPQG